MCRIRLIAALLHLAKAAFDPSSPLTRYWDRGSCGPRGNDAQADTSGCQHGADIIEKVKNNNFTVVATINGCEYFAYTVYRCKARRFTLLTPECFGGNIHNDPSAHSLVNCQNGCAADPGCKFISFKSGASPPCYYKNGLTGSACIGCDGNGFCGNAGSCDPAVEWCSSNYLDAQSTTQAPTGVQQMNCDDTPAPATDHPSSTCGSRWKWMITAHGHTMVGAKCFVKYELPQKCDCLPCDVPKVANTTTTSNTSTTTTTTSTTTTTTRTTSVAKMTVTMQHSQATACSALTTDLNHNNNRTGIYFKVVLGSALTITAFKYIAASAGTLQVWTRPGTYGAEVGLGWVLAMNATGQQAGNNIVMGSLQFSAGSHMILLSSSGKVKYKNGASVGVVHASNADLGIYSGYGTQDLTPGSIDGYAYSPRNFAGTIEYCRCSALTTDQNPNNRLKGIYFKVVLGSALTITAVQYITKIAGTLQVWTRPGTYGAEVGSGWVLAMNATGQQAGNNIVVGSLQLSAGSHMILLSSSGKVKYKNGASVGIVHASNADLGIYSGYGTQDLTPGSIDGYAYSPRNFAGTIKYCRSTVSQATTNTTTTTTTTITSTTTATTNSTTTSTTTTTTTSTTCTPTTTTRAATTRVATTTSTTGTLILAATSSPGVTTTTSNLTAAVPSLRAWRDYCIEGQMSMHVTNAAAFVLEPNVTTVMSYAIASIHEVDVSFVRNVRLVAVPNSRLLNGDRSDLVAPPTARVLHQRSGDVDVTWMIVIPADSINTIEIHVLIHRFNSQEINKITQKVNSLVKAGHLGDPYTVNVTYRYMTVQKRDAEIVGESSNGNQHAMVIVVLCGVAVVAMSIAAAYILVKFYRKHLESGGICDFTPIALLAPPKNITRKQGRQLRTMAKCLCLEAHPRVCLTYAAGTRDGDAEGYGPGTFYACAVLRMLSESGVPCISDLVFDEKSRPSDEYRKHIGSTDAPYKVLIVVQTVALYESRSALREIYIAQENSLSIVPLRFEDGLPTLNDQWPDIMKDDFEAMVMVSSVQSIFCTLNSTPSPPYTVVNEPAVMVDVAIDVKLLLKRSGCHEGQGPTVIGLVSQTSPESSASADASAANTVSNETESDCLMSNAPTEEPQLRRQVTFRNSGKDWVATSSWWGSMVSSCIDPSTCVGKAAVSSGWKIKIASKTHDFQSYDEMHDSQADAEGVEHKCSSRHSSRETAREANKKSERREDGEEHPSARSTRSHKARRHEAETMTRSEGSPILRRGREGKYRRCDDNSESPTEVTPSKKRASSVSRRQSRTSRASRKTTTSQAASAISTRMEAGPSLTQKQQVSSTSEKGGASITDKQQASPSDKTSASMTGDRSRQHRSTRSRRPKSSKNAKSTSANPAANDVEKHSLKTDDGMARMLKHTSSAADAEKPDVKSTNTTLSIAATETEKPPVKSTSTMIIASVDTEKPVVKGSRSALSIAANAYVTEKWSFQSTWCVPTVHTDKLSDKSKSISSTAAHEALLEKYSFKSTCSGAAATVTDQSSYMSMPTTACTDTEISNFEGFPAVGTNDTEKQSVKGATFVSPVPPDIGSQCVTPGCKRPSWNRQPREPCCRSCAKHAGKRHGFSCQQRFELFAMAQDDAPTASFFAAEDLVAEQHGSQGNVHIQAGDLAAEKERNDSEEVAQDTEVTRGTSSPNVEHESSKAEQKGSRSDRYQRRGNKIERRPMKGNRSGAATEKRTAKV